MKEDSDRNRIRQQYLYLCGILSKAGLLQEETVFLMPGKIILNAEGEPVSSFLFDEISAGYALYTYGTYTKAYAERNRPLKASIDDAAQMFGSRVPVREKPGKRDAACLIWGGFVVTGRFAGELAAAAVLMEKACQTELLAEKIGRVRYLDPVLAEAEHAVYMLKYSKHEKEAADERG